MNGMKFSSAFVDCCFI